MYSKEEKQVEELLKTVAEALVYAKDNIVSSNIIMSDIHDALLSIFTFIEEKKLKYNSEIMLDLAEELTSFETFNKTEKEKVIDSLMVKVKNIIEKFSNLNSNRKIKALFLPYKESMWTSLESIWKEANEDPECEAVVMPIPYHELDENLNKVKICYEGDKYPEYLPIKRFWEYDISVERPDMIFIHNPYDDTNLLTRVSDEYYSRNLKRYTENLVYVPYHTTYVYSKDKSKELFNTDVEALKYVDNVVVENEEIKEKYEENKNNIGKVLALGSPKFDAIYNMRNNGFTGVQEWKSKIENKKVFLLVTTLSMYTRLNEVAIENVLKVYNEMVKRENCVLIWRPHPLEEQWVRRARPDYLKVYYMIKKKFLNSKNTFIDYSEEYRTIFNIADGSFFANGSLVSEFMAMGKSVYSIDLNVVSENEKLLIDPVYNYYIEDKDINEYIDDVVSGKEDELSSKRIEIANRSINNYSDGSCGKKVYQEIKRQILNK